MFGICTILLHTCAHIDYVHVVGTRSGGVVVSIPKTLRSGGWSGGGGGGKVQAGGAARVCLCASVSERSFVAFIDYTLFICVRIVDARKYVRVCIWYVVYDDINS